ncbi:MAG: GntR family transcriptional regulator [Pseudorhodobacter sp.]|nr:GntR family transcriptional regulator [Pseudorhodobacter sp.]
MKQAGQYGFREVKRAVLDRVRNGVWGPGTLLPNEAELAREFGCSRATVNRALRELSDEGIVDRRRRAGTQIKLSPVRQVKFEIPLVRAEVLSSGAEYRYVLVSRAIQVAPDWLRARLDLQPSARILHLECMHYASGAPFQFEDRWINLDTVPAAETADFSKINPNEWLIATVPFTNAEVRLSATAATRTLSDFLQLPMAAPVFMAERTTWLSGQAITLTRLYFSGGYAMVAQY